MFDIVSNVSIKNRCIEFSRYCIERFLPSITAHRLLFTLKVTIASYAVSSMRVAVVDIVSKVSTYRSIEGFDIYRNIGKFDLSNIDISMYRVARVILR